MSIVGCGEIEEMNGRLKGQGMCSRSAMKELLVRLIHLFVSRFLSFTRRGYVD